MESLCSLVPMWTISWNAFLNCLAHQPRFSGQFLGMRRFAGGMANNDAFAGVQAVSALPEASQLLGTGIAECEWIGKGFAEGTVPNGCCDGHKIIHFKRLLVCNPNQRIGADAALSHRYFSGIGLAKSSSSSSSRPMAKSGASWENCFHLNQSQT